MFLLSRGCGVVSCRYNLYIPPKQPRLLFLQKFVSQKDSIVAAFVKRSELQPEASVNMRWTSDIFDLLLRMHEEQQGISGKLR